MDVLRRHVNQRALLTTLVLALVTLLAAAPGARASHVMAIRGDTAAGENKPGWLFNRDTSTATPFEFSADEASIGHGSIYVKPIGSNPSDKFIAEYFMLERMGRVDSISYDFLIGPGGDSNDANHFYMNVYANFAESDATKFYDCRYNIVPADADDGWTTVEFDPDGTYPVTQRTGPNGSPRDCPGSPAAMGEDATLRVIALNLGDTSANDVDLDGYFDNVVVTVDGEATVYDFEPAPPNKFACKRCGYVDYGFRSERECIRFAKKNGGHDWHPGKWGHGRHDSHPGKWGHGRHDSHPGKWGHGPPVSRRVGG